MDVVEAALADLRRSGIDAAAAGAAGIYAADDASEIDGSLRDLPALVIPYIAPDGAPMLRPDGGEFLRVRYLAQPTAIKGLGKKKDIRYSQPAGSGVRAYFPRVDGVDWPTLLADPKQPLVITEGEKKALAATLAGFPAIGLGGVFNWLTAHDLLPELAAIQWDKRNVYICFDSDAATNANILAAEARLATELGIKHGAEPLRVRIPPPKDKDAGKIGLDDLLVAKGPGALNALIQKALPVRSADRGVLELNQQVAWIERDGLVLDLETQLWIQKHNFIKGSAYSAYTIPSSRSDGVGIKNISVANEWLTSPLAQRYADVVFAPGLGRTAPTEDGGVQLNLWKGYSAAKGDVTPWLRLTEHLTRNLPTDQQDFAACLLAYKAQNPALKIPIAAVFVGPQGCGKSMWAKCVREAFTPYGVAVPSKALLSDFNPWVESSLVAVIDEAQAMHMTKGSDILKSLISEQRTYLNQKYRAARQVESYTLYILTSNDRRVGAYSQDDRRMFVIDTPPPADESLYIDCVKWLEAGGGKHLIQWLLDYDLKDWRPPQRAPMTSEKYMAYMESLTPVQRLAEEMQTASVNTVKLWLDAAMEWALGAELSAPTATRAREVKEALGHIQVRPFYTPEELMLIFPAMAGQLHGLEKAAVWSSGDLSRQLRECRITYLRCADDPRGFTRYGRVQQYLIISEPDKWAAPITQAEFNAAMAGFAEYRNL